MQKIQQAPEKILQAMYPVLGIDKAGRFDLQRPGTTPIAQNVRAFEPLSGRGRGGSRPGLGRYINGLVNGAHEIQHLAVIVDPQADALGTNQENEDYGPDGVHANEGIFDPTEVGPRNPGRFVRRGGGGRQPNRKRPRTMQRLQSRSQQFNGNYTASTGVWAGQSAPGVPIDFNLTPTTLTLAFTDNVTSGSVLLAVVADIGAAGTVSIADSQGNSYTKVVDYNNVSVWWAVAGSSGANTVQLTWTATDSAFLMTIMEYKGVNTSSPIDTTTTINQSLDSATGAQAGGTLTLAADTETLVAIYFALGGNWSNGGSGMGGYGSTFVFNTAQNGITAPCIYGLAPGYADNDVVTFVQGTGTKPTIKILLTSGGIVQNWKILTSGHYTVWPATHNVGGTGLADSGGSATGTTWCLPGATASANFSLVGAIWSWEGSGMVIQDQAKAGQIQLTLTVSAFGTIYGYNPSFNTILLGLVPA